MVTAAVHSYRDNDMSYLYSLYISGLSTVFKLYVV